MGYIDLIPDVFRMTMPDLATGKSYHTQKFNVGNKQCIGVTIKASQALSVSVAYGIATDTAAAAGVDIAASLPYKTSATSFASNTSTEGGTYHEIALPPHARQAQLVISNASGSTVSGAVIDAALRVVAGSSDFASITGWPGSSSQFVHADGSYSPLSAADIPTGIDAAKIANGTVSNAEYQRLDGVTAPIQGQINLALQSIVPATVAGGSTANAYNLTTASAPVAGQILVFTSTGDCTGAMTLNVNSAGAVSLLSQNGNAITTGIVKTGRRTFVYYDGTAFYLMGPQAGGGAVNASEALYGFTGTKDSTTVPNGAGTMVQGVTGSWYSTAFISTSGASAILRPATSDGADTLASAMLGAGANSSPGSVQTRGAVRIAYGNEHPTYPGIISDCVGEAGYQSFYNAAGVEAFRFTGGALRCPSGNTVAGANAERWIGPRTGSSVSWFANAPTSGTHGWGVNGTESFRVDANGPRGDAFTPLSAANAVLRTNTSAASDTLKAQMAAAGAVDATRGAINEVVGVNATNEAGANIRRSTGMARAASTSFNLVAVAAGDNGFARIVDNVGAGTGVNVRITNGAITDLQGDTTNYTTSSPSSTQTQFTIAGGFLVATTGSSWTRKFGVNEVSLTRMV